MPNYANLCKNMYLTGTILFTKEIQFCLLSCTLSRHKCVLNFNLINLLKMEKLSKNEKNT